MTDDLTDGGIIRFYAGVASTDAGLGQSLLLTYRFFGGT